jgi:hypothetical protein
LLDIYRFSPVGRQEYLDILTRLRERIFVPHQVALEFHRRRVDAVADRIFELDALREEAAKATASTKNVVNRLRYRARALRDQIPDVLQEQSAVLDFVDKVIAEYDLRTEDVAGGHDDVYPLIESLLIGRVGSEPTVQQREVDQREGEERLESGRAPGFKDKGKAENATGDYLWWAELIRYAKAVQQGPVLVVTNETSKGDWTYEKKGIRIGPHLDLVEEMRRETGHPLLIATVSELVRFAGTHLLSGSAVSAETVAEAQDIARSAEIKRRSRSDRTSLKPRYRPISVRQAVEVSGVPAGLLSRFIDDDLLLGLHRDPRRPTGYHFHVADVVRAMFLQAAHAMGASQDDLVKVALDTSEEVDPVATLFWRDGKGLVARAEDEVSELRTIGWTQISPSFDELLEQVRRHWPGANDDAARQRPDKLRRIVDLRDELENLELEIERGRSGRSDLPGRELQALESHAHSVRRRLLREETLAEGE